MITNAALCPSPPLLYPGMTGRQAVAPELRAACAEAARRLVHGEPEEIVVVGPAGTTRTWAPASRLDELSDSELGRLLDHELAAAVAQIEMPAP